MEKGIKMYGTTWCADCFRAKHFLEDRNIPYQFINIEEDEQALIFLRSKTNGFDSVPLLLFPDDSFLIEPSLNELEKKFI